MVVIGIDTVPRHRLAKLCLDAHGVVFSFGSTVEINETTKPLVSLPMSHPQMKVK